MRKILFVVLFFMMFSMRSYALGHLDLVPIEGVYSSQSNIVDGSYFSSNQKKYIIDGDIVYCVEPGMNIMTNDYNINYDLFNSSIDSEVIEKMKLIGYYGYDYIGHKSDYYFLATQELIWELLNNDVYFTTGINGSGSVIDIEKEKNEIMDLVNKHYVKPSFDGVSFEGIYQESIVLTDSNNVLSNYEVVSSNNDVLIDGNKLVIKFTNLGSDKVVLRKKKYDNRVSLFYNADGSQDFMFFRVDDILSVINVESYLPSSAIEVFKTGEQLIDIDGDLGNYDFVYRERGKDVDAEYAIYLEKKLTGKLFWVLSSALSPM